MLGLQVGKLMAKMRNTQGLMVGKIGDENVKHTGSNGE